MALWLVRAGSHGEYEKRFLEDAKIYLTWEGIDTDLGKITSKGDLRDYLEKTYPDSSKGMITNHTGQIWAFIHGIKPGDWIVLPSKHKSAIHIAEVESTLIYDGNAEDIYRHSYKVNWFATDIPRSNFDQDILYSFGAFMTICQIKRNDAEKRIHAMQKNNWHVTTPSVLQANGDASTEGELSDLSQIARDQIAKLILAKFKGHGMARLVNAILEAQGYTTHVSPEGPDKGVDILAAPGPMGFGEPRLCVQVKSGDTPLDTPTLNQLIGTMQNVQAQHGLFVSWSGFKSSVDKEKAIQFFRVRLWDRDDLIEQLLNNYEKLDDSIRAELPLKRIWTVAYSDSDD
jgi:restriction system protein